MHTPGPWFETPTEDRLYRRLGFDLVGKTAGPEFRLARMYGMCLGILSIVVNPAEGLGEFEHADLRAIYRRCGPAMARMVMEALAEAAAEPDRAAKLSLRRRAQRLALTGILRSRPLWRRPPRWLATAPC